MIVPTIGSVVWFWPERSSALYGGSQPLAAIVTYVHSDRMVNLAVFDSGGNFVGATTSVQLYQGDAYIDRAAGLFCEWMPYQKAVASGQQPPTLHAQPEATSRPPYQQRVYDEKHELDARLAKLNDFLTGAAIGKVDRDEQARLSRQAAVMAEYSLILSQRIEAF